LIRKCLEHGFNDEQIEGILREHMWQKMQEQEQEQANAPPKAAAPARAPEAPSMGQSMASRLVAKSQESLSSGYQKELSDAQHKAPPPECTFEARKPSSVAAKRQARAASSKSISFGPSDDEIVGIIEQGRTPTPPMDESKRHEQPDDAHSAFLQNQQRAAAAKNRNRGQGIF
jgi:hypothetical protein